MISNSLNQPFSCLSDIPYRPAAFYVNAPANTERCKLDITYPAESKGFSTVIWFHGGGLTAGAKHTPMALTEDASHPSAVVACGYRLAQTDGATVATCIDDAACAVAWVLQHIAEYGGDPSKVFVSGHSAGAYLSCMIGMVPQYLRNYGSDYTQIRGLLPISSQCISHFTQRAERGIPMTQPVCDEFAPLFHVGTPNLPPIMLTTGQGDLELCGRTEENAYFCRMLKLNGHQDVQHFILNGYGHNCVAPSMPLCVQFVNRLAWS